jgi:hypothetical protein
MLEISIVFFRDLSNLDARRSSQLAGGRDSRLVKRSIGVVSRKTSTERAQTQESESRRRRVNVEWRGKRCRMPNPEPWGKKKTGWKLNVECSFPAHHDATPLFLPLPAVEEMEPRLSSKATPHLRLGSAVQTDRNRTVHRDNPRKPPT